MNSRKCNLSTVGLNSAGKLFISAKSIQLKPFLNALRGCQGLIPSKYSLQELPKAVKLRPYRELKYSRCFSAQNAVLRVYLWIEYSSNSFNPVRQNRAFHEQKRLVKLLKTHQLIGVKMVGQLVNLWRKLCRWPQVRILVDLISRDLRNQQKKGFKIVSEHNRFYKNALNKNVRKNSSTWRSWEYRV